MNDLQRNANNAKSLAEQFFYIAVRESNLPNNAHGWAKEQAEIAVMGAIGLMDASSEAEYVQHGLSFLDEFQSSGTMAVTLMQENLGGAEDEQGQEVINELQELVRRSEHVDRGHFTQLLRDDWNNPDTP